MSVDENKKEEAIEVEKNLGGRPRSRTIELFDKQKQIIQDPHRFKFVCCGRRWGKTMLAEETLWSLATAKPNQIIYYVAPTFKLAKDLMWLNLTSRSRADVRFASATSATITFKNGSRICIRGSDREDNIRGFGIDFVVMEEYSFHKRGVWELIIRPALADRKGGALFIGTPSMKKGPHYRQLHDYAKSGKDKEWAYFHYTIHDNPYIDKGEIVAIQNSNTDVSWKQEYLAEFVEEEGTVYYEFNEMKHVYNPNASFQDANKFKCVCGIDWGLVDNTGVAWVHIMPDGRLCVTDEHEKNNWTIKQQAAVIKTKNMKHPALCNSILDQTAFRRDPKDFSNTGAEFRKNGIQVTPSEYSPDEGIRVTKSFLIGDEGRPWLFVSNSCKSIIKHMQEWQYDSHEPDVLSGLRFAIQYIWKAGLSPLCGKIDLTRVVKSEPVTAMHEEIYGNDNNRTISLKEGKGMSWNFEYGGWD